MKLPASLVGLKIPSHYGGHYNFAQPWDKTELLNPTSSKLT